MRFAVYSLGVMVLLIAVCISTLNYSIIRRVSYPYMLSVKQVSIFNTIQKVESLVISAWVMTDFIIISIFTYIVLRMFKSFFALKEERPLRGIYLTFVYLFSLYICSARFELEKFSSEVAIQVNTVLGLGIPLIMLIVGKVRRKL